MLFSINAVNLIKQYEGCKLTAYPDPGSGDVPWTIGYGSTGPDVVEGLTITQDDAEQRLEATLASVSSQISDVVTVDLNQNQFDALVSFTYNEGIGRLETSTLLKLINQGDFADAANEFHKWDLSGGRVLNGLISRRLAEKQLFLS